MKSYKSTIIRKYGTSVCVDRLIESEIAMISSTKALLGRASRNNNNMRTLNNQKEGIFLPDCDVQSGDFIRHVSRGDVFVVGGVHPEYEGDSILSKVCNLLVCHHTLTIRGTVRVADERGNLKTQFGDKYKDVPCYLEEVDDGLRQYEPGLHPDTEYRIYTAKLEIDDNDQLVINVLGKEEKFKVVARNYVTFPGLLVIEVKRDVRA